MSKYPHQTAFDSIDWTVQQYHAMAKAGILDERKPVELLFGKIILMSPVGSPHAACVSNIQEEFIIRFGRRFTYRTQDPITILPISEPQPDFVIARRSEDNYATSPHPSSESIIVLIEVSDSSLDKDQGLKLALYAEASVPEYWIVNLVDRQFEVYREPDGHSAYQDVRTYAEGSTFQHPVLGEITVDQLLPAKLTPFTD